MTIIQLDYYDGPTEGISSIPSVNKVYYFRVIAWDDCQDKRVFAVVPATPSDLKTLESVFSRLPFDKFGDAKIPRWDLIGDDDKRITDYIMKKYRRKIAREGMIFCDDHFSPEKNKLILIDEKMRPVVKSLLNNDEIGDMGQFSDILGIRARPRSS